MTQPETSPYPQACASCYVKNFLTMEGPDDLVIAPGKPFYRADDGACFCEECYQSDIPVNHPAYKRKP